MASWLERINFRSAGFMQFESLHFIVLLPNVIMGSLQLFGVPCLQRDQRLAVPQNKENVDQILSNDFAYLMRIMR